MLLITLCIKKTKKESATIIPTIQIKLKEPGHTADAVANEMFVFCVLLGRIKTIET